MNRSHALARLDGGSFDLLVVGGGATGLGIAVDAASRGHSVALLEQADFAKATSSRSTKLVHGGVRYLRQGNVSLVRHALLERARLLQNAPHLVRPLPLVIPGYRWWQSHYYGIGLKVYDALAGRLGIESSRRLSRGETLQRLPGLRADGLSGGVLYHDAQFDDARLAVHLAMTADRFGAAVVNYVRVTGLVKHKGRVTGVTAIDLESDRSIEIRARSVINATGVFVDDLRSSDDASAAPLVTVSQGVHLVLPRRFLPGDTALMVPKTDDGRVLFALPWRDRLLVGTTDTPVPRAELEPRPLRQELDFVLQHARHYLGREISREHVCSVYAGLRPLVKSGRGGPTARLSRDHTIEISPSGLLTITGGKWTTYRKMAEDAVDRAQDLAGLAQRPCRTADMPLHAAAAAAVDDLLGSAYGSDAGSIRALVREQPDLGRPLHPQLPYLRAEVVWQARQEMARNVEDVLARRTRALVLDAGAAASTAEEVARLLAAELGRDAAWQARQVAEFTTLADGYRMPQD